PFPYPTLFRSRGREHRRRNHTLRPLRGLTLYGDRVDEVVQVVGDRQVANNAATVPGPEDPRDRIRQVPHYEDAVTIVKQLLTNRLGKLHSRRPRIGVPVQRPRGRQRRALPVTVPEVRDREPSLPSPGRHEHAD